MENNFLSLIKTRRSVRAYKSDPVPSEALDAVLEAGTYAPTGGGRQSPTIIAITDPKYRQEIAKLNAEVMGSSTDPYYGAPAVVLVLADGGASTFVEDGSCVLENMMLAAHALGLGTVWVHREREIFRQRKRQGSPAGVETAGNLARCRGDCTRLSSPGSRSTRSTQTKLYRSDLKFLLSGAMFLRRTLCGEEGKYADQ